MRHPETLEEIVEGGLCIGCGICQSIAGADRVEMVMMAPGQLRPKVKAALDDAVTAKILDVCPGASIDGAMPSSRTEGVFTDPVFGQWAGVTRGYAADDEVRFRAAAGGVLTALGQFVLDTGRVECVLHVQQSADDPIRSYRKVSTDSAQVLAGAGSRYCPVAPLEDVTELLDQGKRFAFMGKPCDVAALRNLARWDKRVDEQVPYMLTISCAGVPKLQCTHEFLARHNMAADELDVMRYRGYGWPGRTYARAHDGRKAEEDIQDHLVRARLAGTIPLQDLPGPDRRAGRRCLGRRLAPRRRARGRGARWLEPDRRAHAPGRSPGARDAKAAGYLYTEPYDIFALYDTQPHQTRKTQGILARLAAMWVSGVKLPRYRRTRVLRAALTAHPMFHLRNFLGLKRRLRDGGNGEAAP